MIQHLDRLAVTNVLSGKKTSWIGLCGTLIVLGLCLALYVPAVVSYFEGNYYQSQYMTYQNHTGYIYSKEDFKIALVVKDKLTGKPYNHTEILNTLDVQIKGWTVDSYFYQLLQPCDHSYFVGDINGEYLQDCMVIPNQMVFDVAMDGEWGDWAELRVAIQTPYIDIPFPQYSAPLTLAKTYYNKLSNNSYIQFYFTSKVVTPSNQVKFQVHSFYTTEFLFTPSNLWSSFSVNEGFRLTMMDDSILPWRNNRNISTLNWNGQQRYVADTTTQYGIIFDDSQVVAVRYYKKLDWLLGIIGGGMFFTFIIFWCIFNPINRWLQRIELPSKFFLRNTTIQNPQSQQDLVPLKVSPLFLLRNLWPFCKDKKNLRILSASEHENNIVLLLKKLKVAMRNLHKKELITQFKAKFIAFPGDDVNALNRFLKPEDSEYTSELSSEVSSKSSSVSKSSKKSEKTVEVEPLIAMDSHSKLNELQYAQINEQSIHQEQRRQKRLGRRSSRSGDNQSDDFQFINNEGVEQFLVERPQVEIKKDLELQKQQQIRASQAKLVSKQQQSFKPPEVQANKFPILQTNENDNPVIENHIILPSMPFNQPVPPIIIVNNDEQIAIIPAYQPAQQVPTIIPAYHSQQEQVFNLNQSVQRLNQNQNGQYGANPQPIPVEQLSPQRKSEGKIQKASINGVQAQRQEQIIFQQRQQVDQKFNFNNEQLLVLRENKELQQILATNPTFWTFRENKPQHFQNLMQINQYDQYEGHFPNKKIKCKTMIANKIAAFFKWLDVFWVRVNLQERESGSICGIVLTLLIIALSILTFALTINNMKNYQYRIDKQYIQPNDIFFTGNTSDSLNIVVCTQDNSYFQGSSQVFSLKFFVNVNGKITTITPIQMTWDDNTFNLYGNKKWVQYTPYCYKMPANVPIILNSTSYFGYTITPYCPGTAAACLAARLTFVDQASTMFINTYMPSNTIDFNSTKLISSISKKRSQTFSNIGFTINSVYQETMLAEIVELKDDSGNQFMGPPSSTIQSNINVGPQSSKQLIKASNGSAPSYSFALKPSQSKTVYTLSQRKLSFILGIIGGVFVFWYSIISTLAFLYNKFHFHMFVAKELYQEQGYDDFVLSKLFAALRIPPCFLPKCCDIRDDIQRMQGVYTKIEKSLNLPSLIKYVDNVYRLSSSFFDNIALKQLSLLYFKQKIDEASKVVEVIKVKQNEEPQFMSAYDQAQDKQKDKEALIGQIANQTKMSFFQSFADKYNKQLQATAAQTIIQIQRYNQNIIEDPKPCCSTIPDMFDMFQEPASFTLRQTRKIQSCFGGLLTLIMIVLIVTVVIQPVLLYLTPAGRIISYQTQIDGKSNANNGITLITGTNFKLGVSALNATSMLPGNISSYVKSTVGISILVIQTNKTNGVLTTTQNSIDLIPCPLNYLNSWLSPTAVIPNDNFQNAYCVPDGVRLNIEGVATDQIHKYFKLSIYDKSNTVTGYKNLLALMSDFIFQIHYSSPERNYVDQSMRYFVWSTIFDLPGKTHVALAIQRNMTLSKVNITYDGDVSQWQKDPLTQISYVYDDFVTQRMNYAYLMSNTTNNIWYNVSFAFNKKMYLYTVTTPKFYEVWGLVGGVIAFFFFISNCIGSSFNNYKLRYLIGRQLYNFDRLKDGSTKIKRRKVDKQMFHEINNYGQGRILMAYFLSGIARIINDYQFNDTLRRVTLIQKKVKEDLDVVDFYKNLYIARESINKELQKRHHIFRRIKPTDLYLKHIYNPSPLEYNYTDLLNYAKQNNLSSFQQRVVLKAKEARVNIREVFDGKFLAKTFGLQDDNRSAHLNEMRETIGSFNSSSGGGSFGPSLGEPSVNLD